MAVHILWDNSNVLGGLDTIRQKVEPDVPWYALRVYFPHIYMLAANKRHVKTKVIAGSLPPNNDELWNYAHDLGFNTDLLQRVESIDDMRIKEQGVDEVLHLKMANAVLRNKAPQTMVLLSGDSKKSDYDTSFPDQVKSALEFGWNVEIFSAKDAMGYKAYAQMQKKYGNHLQIFELDKFYKSISFVKGGTYHTLDENGQKVFFQVKSRKVSYLQI